MTIKVTTVGASWVGTKHKGVGPWLAVIHEVNRTRPGTFLDPELDTDGGYAEVYPGARVTFVGTDAQDQLVTITGTSDDVAWHIRKAAETLGLRCTEVDQ